jgi:hypothetical protein
LTPEESEVEGREHQDNADIHCEPFPETVSEEREIDTDDDGYHRRHVKHDTCLSAHFSKTSTPAWINQAPDKPAEPTKLSEKRPMSPGVPGIAVGKIPALRHATARAEAFPSLGRSGPDIQRKAPNVGIDLCLRG